MVLSEYARWLRVSIGDTIVRTTDDVRISSSLDQMNRVCSFTLAELPVATPADGARVLVELVDTKKNLAYDLFGGLIDGGPEVDSEPFGMTVRAVDQLSNLRLIHTGADMDLTGMTPKTAKMAIFDYCNIVYDAADLVDIDYELGELEPIKWLSDGSTTAGSIISEIDRIFGLSTQTIGDDRVISFRYDYMPEDATGLYRTFTKGSSIDFQAHHRTRGSRNDLQTIWTVTGVEHKFNGDECSMTPWAKSVHGTARIGRSRRVPEGTDSSDLIQDESLAEFVVRQHMARTSGISDTGTASTVTSRNLHPGSKIAIQDPTYGIEALPRYYCVTQVEITGLLTDMTLVAGPPGSEGTVTTGVDRVCNDSHSDGDLPGDFEPPDFEFPPLDGGEEGDEELPTDFPEEPESPDIPEEPNTTDPFLACTEDAYLGICPEPPEDPDPEDPPLPECHPMTGGIEMCEGTPPLETVCKTPGWHRQSWSESEVAYTCLCEIKDRLRVESSVVGPAYLLAEDGSVDKITTCGLLPDEHGGTVTLFPSTIDNPESSDAESDQCVSGDICISATVQFCYPGERIDLRLFSSAGDCGDYGSIFTEHAMLLYAEPGHLQGEVWYPETYVGSNLEGVGLQGGERRGTAAPHHSYGPFNFNNGGYPSMDGGLPIGSALDVSVCFQLDPTQPNPIIYWNNGVESGYMQHNPWLYEEDHFGQTEPSEVFESDTHVIHAIGYVLVPNNEEAPPRSCFVDPDCPGPMIWNIQMGHSTCAQNPDYIPPVLEE